MESTLTGELVAGRYELGPLLGRGGMATVYAATDRRLQRDVAVKLLHPEMAARADVRRRFESEARAAARLTHPNVVAVFDSGEHDGVPYIVMERLSGETLADLLRGGPLPVERVARIAHDVLGALGAAHTAGIVHRDVKPGNILIGGDGSVKVADFGIATRVDADPTSAGHLIGTPAYLAPERLEGGAASPRSDLYSLGVVLYEAIAGTKPFTGDSPVQVADAIRRGTHVPLAAARPDADARVADAIERSMARDPDARFPSAAAMAVAIAHAPESTQVLPLTAPPRADRRRRWAALVAAAVVGTAIVAALTAANDDAPARTDAPATTTIVTQPPATEAPPPTTTSLPERFAEDGDDDEGNGGGKGRGGKGRD